MLYPFNEISPDIDSTVFCVESADIIGDVKIEVNSSVWYQVVIRGDVNYIRIGKRTNVQDGTVIHVTNRTNPTIIGDDVTIGHNATLHGCTIGNRCLIGMGAVVLDGAEVGDDVMIGAGALVTPGTIIPAGTLYVGSPAKYKRHLSIAEIEGLGQSAKNYLDYVARYRNN